MGELKLVECVPNFSEGRDKAIIGAIADAIRGVAGISLLDVDPGTDTNRTVYTFVGGPRAVVEAALAGAMAAAALIDMSRHSGAHPRMGAMDVCPFVPVSGVTMEECVELAKETASRLALALDVPVYLYEKAATSESRRNLASVRSGEYEGLQAKLAEPGWKPDYGPARLVPSWGASVVGAREFLVAFNVNLNAKDAKLAREVAMAVREAGKARRDADGHIVRSPDGAPVMEPGRLRHVKAIGWYIDEYRRSQVSINLVDSKATPLHAVYEAVKEEAERRGLAVCGSELVGLVPLSELVEAGRFYAARMGKSPGAPDGELVELAAASMGLGSVAPFDPRKKILEYAAAAPAPLASMSVDALLDEVSSDSPAPGGGSVSALAGALGAALAAMAANLTVGKKGYEASWKAMSDTAIAAQALKSELARAIDEDSRAFDGVMAARRMPKSDEASKAARAEAIEAGYKTAIEVPMRTAEACVEALRAALAAASGNRGSASDAGVAALMARAGAHGAALNVLINLASIGDRGYAERARAKANELRDRADALCAEAIVAVEAAIAGA